MLKNEKEIREYIEQIRALCDKVMESLDEDDGYDLGDEMSELVEDFKEFDNLTSFNDDDNDDDDDNDNDDETEDEEDAALYGNSRFEITDLADEVEFSEDSKTHAFTKLHKNAVESLGLKKLTNALDINRIPYLTRKKTGEKIIVNRNIFKIGKEESYVDYCISDNATISRSHADIVRKTDGFYLKDMGSLNHTFLNGVKLEQNMPKKLENGSLIQLADEVFEWHCD